MVRGHQTGGSFCSNDSYWIQEDERVGSSISCGNSEIVIFLKFPKLIRFQKAFDGY